MLDSFSDYNKLKTQIDLIKAEKEKLENLLRKKYPWRGWTTSGKSWESWQGGWSNWDAAQEKLDENIAESQAKLSKLL